MQNGHHLHPAVVDLRRYLIDLHTKTVNMQRLNAMKYGTPLQISANRSPRKDSQRQVISLSPDHHSLIIRDAENCFVQSWPLTSIKAVYPGIEDRRTKPIDLTIILVFSQETEAESTEMLPNSNASIRDRFNTLNKGSRDFRITLFASSELSHTYWMDGFWILGKCAHGTVRFSKDLNTLVEIELRVRMFGLCDTELPDTSAPLQLAYPDLTGLPFEVDRE